MGGMGRRSWRTGPGLVAVGGLMLASVVGVVGLSAGTAAAARRPICVGTTDAPGVLSGNYRSGVIIKGFCTVNDGPATIHGKLILAPGSALIAAYALNDLTGKGTSSLTVLGNVSVRHGATLVFGCDAAPFPCLDDTNASTAPAARRGGRCGRGRRVAGRDDRHGGATNGRPRR